MSYSSHITNSQTNVSLVWSLYYVIVRLWPRVHKDIEIVACVASGYTVYKPQAVLLIFTLIIVQ